MARDFSWGVSAREYGKIYERVRQMRAHELAASAIATAANPKNDRAPG